MFLKLTEKDGLWKKIRNHVGTTVEHPVSPATRNIRSRISDDGVGVREADVPGVGLRSIRERAEELGGTCTIRPNEGGRGTTVLASIPLQREA